MGLIHDTAAEALDTELDNRMLPAQDAMNPESDTNADAPAALRDGGRTEQVPAFPDEDEEVVTDARQTRRAGRMRNKMQIEAIKNISRPAVDAADEPAIVPPRRSSLPVILILLLLGFAGATAWYRFGGGAAVVHGWIAHLRRTTCTAATTATPSPSPTAAPSASPTPSPSPTASPNAAATPESPAAGETAPAAAKPAAAKPVAAKPVAAKPVAKAPVRAPIKKRVIPAQPKPAPVKKKPVAKPAGAAAAPAPHGARAD
jgi:hypothetical protein